MRHPLGTTHCSRCLRWLKAPVPRAPPVWEAHNRSLLQSALGCPEDWEDWITKFPKWHWSCAWAGHTQEKNCSHQKKTGSDKSSQAKGTRRVYRTQAVECDWNQGPRVPWWGTEAAASQVREEHNQEGHPGCLPCGEWVGGGTDSKKRDRGARARGKQGQTGCKKEGGVKKPLEAP